MRKALIGLLITATAVTPLASASAQSRDNRDSRAEQRPERAQKAQRQDRRDERGAFMDWFGISIDPERDGRTAYQFKISAAGSQQDIYISDDTQEDMAWNAVWESATTIDSLGWMLEVRLPLSQIRYESGDGGVTRRVTEGELAVRVPLLMGGGRTAGVVEQAIVSGLRDHFAAEVGVVERLLRQL